MSAALAPTAVPAWAPYRPAADAPWDLRRVVHLYRRAGFAATWEEIQQALRNGPDVTLDWLLSGRMCDRSPDGFDETARLLAESAVSSRQPVRLKACWIYRMLRTPDPLTEQLMLMWHNHFATSDLKVDDPGLMWRQNETFRRFARAPFGELLRSVLRDSALLIWLDAPANRRGVANENLARELLELFTLGIGHYTELDVKEAARALTGWTIEDGRWTEKPEWHDPGVKTILGRTGRWQVSDLIEILLDHPATANRIAWRICDHFLGEGRVSDDEIAGLAGGLRERNLDAAWAVETILRSATFFDEANLAARIVSPVEFVLGAVRALELVDPGPSPAILADWMAELGQDLFYPPNVGGWPGGQSWLSPRTLVSRARFAIELAEGRLFQPPHAVEIQALAERHGFGASASEMLEFLSQLFLGSALEPAWQEQLLSDLNGAANPGRLLLTRLLASPLAQLG